MATTKEQITAQYRGGFYYTDKITAGDNDTILTASKIVATAVTALKDTFIYEKQAKHLRPITVLIKGRL